MVKTVLRGNVRFQVMEWLKAKFPSYFFMWLCGSCGLNLYSIFFSADLNGYCIMYTRLLNIAKIFTKKWNPPPASTKPTSRCSTKFTPHAILPLRPIYGTSNADIHSGDNGPHYPLCSDARVLIRIEYCCYSTYAKRANVRVETNPFVCVLIWFTRNVLLDYFEFKNIYFTMTRSAVRA